MFLLATVVILLSGVSLSAQKSYKEAIDALLETYPQATLQDIYKSFFQDHFGPEHLISDTTYVRNYLVEELNEMGETSMPYYEPVGIGENYVRVSLTTIKDSLLTEEEVLNAFIESANTRKAPSIDGWKEQWEEILVFVPDTVNNYREDKENINALLDSGKYAAHHSRLYNELYHPHYRLIEKNLFRRHLLPKITQK